MSTVLSCIMPVFNAASSLDEAVDSVLSQNWPYFELLLIDDGSTDGSDHLCDEWNKKDDRVRVFHQPHQGVAAARNTGLSHAEGRILCFADADDRLLPGTFSAIVPAFDNRHRDLVSFDMEICTDDETARCEHPAFECETHDELWPHFLSYYQAGLFPSLCNKAYRTELIKKGGLRFDPACAVGEDLEFNLNCWANANSIEHLDTVFYQYRIRPDSLTRSIATDRMDLSRHTLRKMQGFLCGQGQESLYPLLAAAQLPWDSAAFFDQLLDPQRSLTKQERIDGLNKLFQDELWDAALLTELSKRGGMRGKLQRMAATRKKRSLALFSMRFKEKQ